MKSLAAVLAVSILFQVVSGKLSGHLWPRSSRGLAFSEHYMQVSMLDKMDPQTCFGLQVLSRLPGIDAIQQNATR